MTITLREIKKTDSKKFLTNCLKEGKFEILKNKSRQFCFSFIVLSNIVEHMKNWF